MSANRSVRSLAALACFVVLAVSLPTLGQWRYEHRWDSADVSRLAQQAESRSDRFADMVRDRGGRLSESAGDLQNQLNTIRQDADRGASYSEMRADIGNALQVARRINYAMHDRDFMHDRRVDFETARQWQFLRSDLNQMARRFNLHQTV